MAEVDARGRLRRRPTRPRTASTDTNTLGAPPPPTGSSMTGLRPDEPKHDARVEHALALHRHERGRLGGRHPHLQARASRPARSGAARAAGRSDRSRRPLEPPRVRAPATTTRRRSAAPSVPGIVATAAWSTHRSGERGFALAQRATARVGDAAAQLARPARLARVARRRRSRRPGACGARRASARRRSPSPARRRPACRRPRHDRDAEPHVVRRSHPVVGRIPTSHVAPARAGTRRDTVCVSPFGSRYSSSAQQVARARPRDGSLSRCARAVPAASSGAAAPRAGGRPAPARRSAPRPRRPRPRRRAAPGHALLHRAVGEDEVLEALEAGNGRAGSASGASRADAGAAAGEVLHRDVERTSVASTSGSVGGRSTAHGGHAELQRGTRPAKPPRARPPLAFSRAQRGRWSGAPREDRVGAEPRAGGICHAVSAVPAALHVRGSSYFSSLPELEHRALRRPLSGTASNPASAGAADHVLHVHGLARAEQRAVEDRVRAERAALVLAGQVEPPGLDAVVPARVHEPRSSGSGAMTRSRVVGSRSARASRCRP